LTGRSSKPDAENRTIAAVRLVRRRAASTLDEGEPQGVDDPARPEQRAIRAGSL